MKLNLSQLQALDFLLQKLNSTHSYTSVDNELNLVIKIDNSLWKGNFVLYKDYRISNYYIDFDKCIEYTTKLQKELFNIPSDFEADSYRNVNLNNMYLLLTELTSTVKKIDTSSINLQPLLYNAINLETNLSLPFLLLNADDEFEVVSIITSTKGEYTHS